MDIKKKAVSIGLSASLLASLAVTTVGVAPVFAANASSGGGTITPGGAKSAAGTISFTEDNPNAPAAYDQFQDGTITVTLVDAKGGSTLTWDTTSLPTGTTTAGLGSVGASFTSSTTLTITVVGTDAGKIDGFSVSNLKVKANASAALGAAQFRVGTNTVRISQSLFTASGLLVNNENAGSTDLEYTLSAGTNGFVDFQETGATCNGGALEVGQVTIAAKGLSAAETVDSSSATGSGSIIVDAGTGLYHPSGSVVTQQVCAAVFPSFITVGDALAQSLVGGQAQWTAGAARQNLGGGSYFDAVNGHYIKLLLGYGDALLPKDATVTFTIATPGVTFATTSRTMEYVSVLANKTTAPAGDIGAATLTPTSLTFTLPVKTAALDQVWISPEFDVAANVPAGTPVEITVSTSATGVTINKSTIQIATVGYVISHALSIPNVTIGQTNQATGTIVLSETGAGNFVDSDAIGFCLINGDAELAYGTSVWAVVTAGDLTLNVKGKSATQALMTRDSSYSNCYYVTTYSASSVKSTVEIRTGTATAPAAAGANNGPRVNVDAGTNPGPLWATVWSDYNGDVVGGKQIQIANKVWSQTPVASTTSVGVYRGGLNQKVGNIVVSEGYPGMFGVTSFGLCIDTPGVTWANPTGTGQPVVSTNNAQTSLVASYAGGGADCLDIDVIAGSLSGIGQITVGNLRVNVSTGAAFGPIMVHVYGPKVNQVVSPAAVNPRVEAGVRAGANRRTGTFGSAVTAAKGSTVTIRGKANGAAAGTYVKIWRKVGTTGTWKAVAHTYVTLNGYAYYNAKVTVRGNTYWKLQVFGGVSNTLRVRGR